MRKNSHQIYLFSVLRVCTWCTDWADFTNSRRNMRNLLTDMALPLACERPTPSPISWFFSCNLTVSGLFPSMPYTFHLPRSPLTNWKIAEPAGCSRRHVSITWPSSSLLWATFAVTSLERQALCVTVQISRTSGWSVVWCKNCVQQLQAGVLRRVLLRLMISAETSIADFIWV